MPIVLLAAPLGPAALALLEQAGVEVREVDGADRTALLAALPHATAAIVAGPVLVDAEALAAAPGLRVLGSLTVGAGGIDVAAATRRGVLVVEAPDAAQVSTAELVVGLLLAAVRGLLSGRAVGTELFGRTAGVVGLGGTGELVAERLAAFGMSVVAYDPYAPAGRAAQLGVRLLPLDRLLAEADVVTVHLPAMPETTGLVGAAELALARPHLVLVDVEQDGVVDQAALLEALETGRIAGAGVDSTTGPLAGRADVVATPGLRALTQQARERTEAAVVGSVLRALAGEVVPDAVNLSLGPVPDQVAAGLGLAERLGRVLTALADGGLRRLDVEVHGEIADQDLAALERAALTGVLHDVAPPPVTYVNAPLLAAELGVATGLATDPESPDHRNVVTLRGADLDGRTVSVAGTLVGIAQRERLVGVNGFEVDLEPTDHLAVWSYPDQPGMVGTIGVLLGEAGVNIAGMQVARDARGGRALVAMSLDSAVPGEVLATVADAIGADAATGIDLT